MYKRIISILLCLLMVSGMALCLCSCKDDNSDEYPVTVANVTIQSEPENITVLSDCLADIISYMGYDVKMVGRSAEVDQEFLSVVPTVGTTASPDVDAIINNETDLVITETALPDNVTTALSNASIPVLTLSRAKSFDELEALYVNLGTALGGNVTGRKQGQDSYKSLTKTLGDFKNAIPKDAVKTACYLYLNENNELCTLTKGSIEYELFSYNGAINVFSSQETPLVDLSVLKISTPSFIFYNDQAVLDYLKNDTELSTMGALNNDKTYQVKLVDFGRQGTTYEEMAYRMLEFMFITSAATPDEATPDDATSATESETQTASEGETIVGFISDVEE